jgi:prepilin-type N-terminal cleavage/methylation domain-containing protein
MKDKGSGSKGLTVIELLIALSVLAIFAAFLIPNVNEALLRATEAEKIPGAVSDRERQQQAVKEMRNTGTAMFEWLTDVVGAAAAGETTTSLDLRAFPAISHPDLEKLLIPQYIARIPVQDPWENPYDYYVKVKEPLDPQVMAIRSRGRDGKAEGDVYTATSFDPTNYDQDLVWADGFFIRWPQKR